MGSTSPSSSPNTLLITTITFLYFSAFLSLLLASVTSAAVIGTPNAHRKGPSFSKIYAFGDSFTDTGNTKSATGPYSFGHVSNPPYGSTFFRHPTNRYSDGRLVVDFLADALSLPFLPPYLDRTAAADSSNGVNFAVAGSTALDHDFFVRNNVTLDITPQSINTQLLWFDKYLQGKGCGGGVPPRATSPECGRAMEGALFWVGEIGLNDFAYTVGSNLSPDHIRDLAVNNVAAFLEALLEKGARYMVVQGHPMSGCLPLTMTLAPADDRDDLGCAASMNRRSHAYNTLLQAKLPELRRRYPNAVISYADYFAAHHAVMKNPKIHGFTEAFEACCGSGGGPYNFDVFATCGSPTVSRACADPSKYVNWDGVHLTEAMYKVVADLFFHRDYCRPPFKHLLSRN